MQKRIVSLLSVCGAVSGSLYVVACGGSSSKSPDASVKLKDSSGGIDTPSGCQLGMLNGSDLAMLGSAVPIDFMGSAGGSANFTPQAGSDGNLFMGVVIGFGQFSSGSDIGILMEFEDNKGVFGATEAGNWGTPPKTGSNFPMDSDGSGTTGATLDIVNGLSQGSNGIMVNPTKGYIVAGGTTSFSMWSAKAVAKGFTMVDGAFTNVMFEGGTLGSQGFSPEAACTIDMPSFGIMNLGITWPATLPSGAIRPQDAHKIDVSRFQGMTLRNIPLQMSNE